MSDYKEAAIRMSSLEMVQEIITRLGYQSFALKFIAIMWTGLTLGEIFSGGIIIPLWAFWCIDTKLLMMERRYRVLFEDQVKKNVDYYMLEARYYDQAKGCSFMEVFNSFTVLSFYLSLIVTTALQEVF